MLEIRIVNAKYLVYDTEIGMDLTSFDNKDNAQIFIREQDEGYIDKLEEDEVDSYLDLVLGKVRA